MIYIDLTIFSIQKIGGISVVWAEYLKRLKGRDNNLEFVLLYPENDNRIAKEIDLSKYSVQAIKSKNAITKYLPFLIVGNENDVLHTSYYQWCPLYRGVKVLTLHDFMHEKFSSFKSSILHDILKYLSLTSADVVLCISKATEDDFKDIYPKIHAKKDVRVIENAASDFFYSETDIENHNNNFLWVAGRGGYKNFDYALNIIAYLRRQGRDYNLFVVGVALNEAEKKYAKSIGVLDLITIFSDVGMDELRSMYSNALAFLYLSKYEGFGLPILEAQKCSCPVVALKNPASLEVGSDSILYINNDAEHEVLNILETVVNLEERKKIIDKGVINASRYSWKNSVDKLIKVYQDYQG